MKIYKHVNYKNQKINEGIIDSVRDLGKKSAKAFWKGANDVMNFLDVPACGTRANIWGWGNKSMNASYARRDGEPALIEVKVIHNSRSKHEWTVRVDDDYRHDGPRNIKELPKFKIGDTVKVSDSFSGYQGYLHKVIDITDDTMTLKLIEDEETNPQISENTKVTLTFNQLKQLIKESINEDIDDVVNSNGRSYTSFLNSQQGLNRIKDKKMKPTTFITLLAKKYNLGSYSWDDGIINIEGGDAKGFVNDLINASNGNLSDRYFQIGRKYIKMPRYLELNYFKDSDLYNEILAEYHKDDIDAQMRYDRNQIQQRLNIKRNNIDSEIEKFNDVFDQTLSELFLKKYHGYLSAKIEVEIVDESGKSSELDNTLLNTDGPIDVAVKYIDVSLTKGDKHELMGGKLEYVRKVVNKTANHEVIGTVESTDNRITVKLDLNKAEELAERIINALKM